MTYGSLFSGVGGFDLGLDRAGFECAWQVEVDGQCQHVLRRHWPSVPKHEDVTDVGSTELARVDLICGGFPCQDLSVAGNRAGLDGERSGLWHEFRRIIGEIAPCWVLIENVPGLLSSNDGRDMGVVLQGLEELGYGWAYRVLDSRYFGVPQRRRRVFIVGHPGDAGPAFRALFPVGTGLPGDPPPGREARSGVAPLLEVGARTSGDGYRDGDGIGRDGDPMYALQASKQHGVGPLAFQHKASSRQSMNPSPVSPALNVGQGAPAMFAAAGPMLGDYRDRLPGESSNDYWRRMEEHEREHGIDPTEGARPWPSPEPVAGQCHGSSVGPMGTLRKGNGSVTGGVPFVAHPLRARDAKGVSQDGRTGRPYNIVTNERQHGPMAMAGMDEAAETLDASYYKGPGNVWGKERQMVAPQSVPRRLTPIECERLQGFPDDHTAWGVDEDGERVDMADSPRYRMMGNAVTVNVAHWIGRRIKIAQQDTDNG